MAHREVILESILEAMNLACDHSELFTGNRAETIRAEYVFTVAVAMAISKHNAPPGDPYVVRIERDAKTFMKDCVPPLKFGRQGSGGKRGWIRAGRPTICRSGRVDITVYIDVLNNGYWGLQPLCAIELKGFNPAANVVVKDLKRNLAFLRTKGPSVLEFALVAPLHSFRKYGDKDLADNERCLEEKYRGYEQQLGDLSDVNVDYKIERVSFEPSGTVHSGVDYDELDTSTTHHFVGVMVVMSRRIASDPPIGRAPGPPAVVASTSEG